MKISKELKNFHKIFNSADRPYSIQLSAFPTQQPDECGAHIAIRLVSEEDKALGMEMLEKMLDMAKRQQLRII